MGDPATAGDHDDHRDHHDADPDNHDRNDYDDHRTCCRGDLGLRDGDAYRERCRCPDGPDRDDHPDDLADQRSPAARGLVDFAHAPHF